MAVESKTNVARRESVKCSQRGKTLAEFKYGSIPACPSFAFDGLQSLILLGFVDFERLSWPAGLGGVETKEQFLGNVEPSNLLEFLATQSRNHWGWSRYRREFIAET